MVGRDGKSEGERAGDKIGDGVTSGSPESSSGYVKEMEGGGTIVSANVGKKRSEEAPEEGGQAMLKNDIREEGRHTSEEDDKKPKYARFVSFTKG